MRIVVCIKQVLDPSAVNNYALAGNLRIAADGRTLDVQAIPRLINAYDEQALEAALRLRDAGCECRITAVSIGRDLQDPLKHCAALGADEIVAIEAKAETLDHHVVANILAAYIRSSGGADLVLCGRQASDDDQGVVPALIGEALGLPIASLARAIELVDGARLRVTRVTTDGDEIIEGALPAVVTVSNELGEPRFPSARDKMAARKKVPTGYLRRLAGIVGRGTDPARRPRETVHPGNTRALRIHRRHARRSRAAPVRETARRQAAVRLPQIPRNTGLRFSRKAVVPSFASKADATMVPATAS